MGDFTLNVRQKPMDFNRWQLGLWKNTSVENHYFVETRFAEREG
jgi:hypothetical protein